MLIRQQARATPKDTPAPVRPEACPVEDWFAFLGHRWNALILWHLNASALRHHQLMAALPGVTPKVLSERLLGLEKRGLVSKEALAVFPRGVSYTLTAQGTALLKILDQVEVWAAR